jgi:hypothetical protein
MLNPIQEVGPTLVLDSLTENEQLFPGIRGALRRGHGTVSPCPHGWVLVFGLSLKDLCTPSLKSSRSR